jgi:hypothetical protein
MKDDAVIEALEALKDWAMERMLSSGEAPPSDAGAQPEGEAPPMDEPAPPEMEIEAGDEFEDEEEDDEDQKNTVISRHFVGGGAPKRSNKVPVSRR